MDMKTLRQTARERMHGACQVCRRCDGKACAGQLPGMGGIRAGLAFQANIQALDAIYLKSRCIHDVRSPETECEILGQKLTMPVLIAPMLGAKFNMGDGLPEERFARAITMGAKAAGIIACTGDGTNEGFASGLAAIQAVNGRGIPIIKPWENGEIFQRLAQAAAAGCQVAGMDIDTCALTALAKSKRPVSPKSRAELRAIVDRAHELGLKFMLKGVMSEDDARAAEESGCDAIVVSNHGGRSFEALRGTAAALPPIVGSVREICVLVDGGIRSGADILKMLALGARGVLIGRPAIIAAMGGEADGVAFWLGRLRRQLRESMLLTGCAAVTQAGTRLLDRD